MIKDHVHQRRAKRVLECFAVFWRRQRGNSGVDLLNLDAFFVIFARRVENDDKRIDGPTFVVPVRTWCSKLPGHSGPHAAMAHFSARAPLRQISHCGVNRGSGASAVLSVFDFSFAR